MRANLGTAIKAPYKAHQHSALIMEQTWNSSLHQHAHK